MPEIFINGQPVQARGRRDRPPGGAAQRLLHSVLLLAQVAVDPGNCRICGVQPEGKNWVEIACNMPVAEGMRVLTDSDLVRAHRKATLQFITLNHPVDCGICDKAGECTLQDYHFEYNGERSISTRAQGARRPSTSSCRSGSCSTTSAASCARAACASPARSRSRTRSASSSAATSRWCARPRTARSTRDAYSDNVVDICPVGALLSQAVPAQVARLVPEAHAFGMPGLRARLLGQHLAPQARMEAARARSEAEHQHRAHHAARERRRQRPVDLQQGPRPRADLRAHRAPSSAMQKGKPVELAAAIAAARQLIADAKQAVALVSSGARTRSSPRSRRRSAGASRRSSSATTCRSRAKWLEDDLLIRADKNPNTAAARRLFGEPAAEPAFPAGTDLVLVWGEGFNFATLPARREDRSSSMRTCSPRTATPTCSSRSASRPSAPATTRISPAS